MSAIRSNHRRGTILIYMAVAMPLFVMLCAFAVDYGRAQLGKTELDGAAGACARYAVNGIADGTTLAKANWLGQLNPVDGQPLAFAANDVVVGRWDTPGNTFTPGAGSPNAVRVTARRTVPSVFGQFAGAAGLDVTSRATVKFNVMSYGLIGLNSVNMQGNSTASYSSTGGGTLNSQGNIGSNGNITLGNSTTVNGNTFVGAGKAASGGTVTGVRGTLPATLSFPNGDASPYGPNNNDNAYAPSWAAPGGNKFALQNNQTVTLPGGHYYFSDFTMTGSTSLTFTGPATIYCYGTFSMTGSTQTSGNLPANLTLVMVPSPWTGAAPGSVTIGSSAAFYGTIYAPQSDVSVGGTGDVYGSVLGLTVNMTGSGRIVYDLGLDANNGTLTLVE